MELPYFVAYLALSFIATVCIAAVFAMVLGTRRSLRHHKAQTRALLIIAKHVGDPKSNEHVQTLNRIIFDCGIANDVPTFSMPSPETPKLPVSDDPEVNAKIATKIQELKKRYAAGDLSDIQYWDALKSLNEK